jgi:osmotically-inducible protein OsmY
MAGNGKRAVRASRAGTSNTDRESGQPGGGAGRRDEVGPTGVYPMSAGLPPGKHLEIRTPAAWGQGDRGAEGYNDSGGSELVMRDGQLLGGLTAGPGGEPTIDIHGGDIPPAARERGTREAFGFSAPTNYPYAGVASEHRRGRFFGRGPKNYRRSSERIREEISDRLMTHPDIDASDIEVRVGDGIVTLTGTVEDRHEKRLAEYIAEDAIGVDDVDNQLKVRHGFWAALTGEKGEERGDASASSERTSQRKRR